MTSFIAIAEQAIVRAIAVISAFDAYFAYAKFAGLTVVLVDAKVLAGSVDALLGVIAVVVVLAVEIAHTADTNLISLAIAVCAAIFALPVGATFLSASTTCDITAVWRTRLCRLIAFAGAWCITGFTATAHTRLFTIAVNSVVAVAVRRTPRRVGTTATAALVQSAVVSIVAIDCVYALWRVDTATILAGIARAYIVVIAL